MILYVLILALVAVIFNLTLPLMAGLYIVSDLGGSPYLTSYAVSFFCIGNILGVPFGKPSLTGVNPIHLFLFCLIFMCIFSWQSAIATNYIYFIIFRFLEGIASGPLFILIPFTLIPLLSPKKNKTYILALMLLSFSLTPVVAASYGSWIAYYHNWRILFYSNIPWCLFLISFVYFTSRKYSIQQGKSHFDVRSYLLFAISMVFICTALTVGQELDWFRSSLIIFLLIAGSISLIFFILRSLYSPYPIVDIKLLHYFYFSFAMINVALLYAIYFGMVILLGLWLKLYVNYTPNWIALIIGTMSFGAWIPIFISYQHYDPRLPLSIALVFFAVSCFYSTYFNVDIDFNRIAFSRILAGVALAVFLFPLFRLSVETIPAEKTPEGLCFFHVSRLLGSGLGVALFLILWHRRQVFYHDRLGSRLTAFSHVTSQFFDRAKHFNLHGQEALAQLDVYLHRQATALALDDCFFLMGWITVALLLFIALTYLHPDPILNDKVEPSKSPEKQNG